LKGKVMKMKFKHKMRYIWLYIKHWFAKFESEYEHKPRFTKCQGCVEDLKLWKRLNKRNKNE